MKLFKAALPGVLALMLTVNSYSVVLGATETPEQNTDNTSTVNQEVLNVVESFPEAGETEMFVGFPLGFQFDRTLNSTVNNANVTITDESGKQIPNHLQIDQKGLLIIPDEELAFDTQYSVTIPQGTVSDETKSFANELIELEFKTGKEFTRLAGIDRYDTSLKISQEGWDDADVAVLATGKDFPDALAATPLAKMYNAPLLLTDSENLSAETEAELKRLGVSKVFIVGGTGVVSQTIEDKLNSLELETKRLAGYNRYETALAIANHMGQSEEIFVVTGENFPDALSIASYAASIKAPIILTDRWTLPSGVKDYISNNGVSHAYIIGGDGIIAPQVQGQLPIPSDRIAGTDRYETNLQVLMNFEIYGSATFIATAENFPDALAGSAMAGMGPFAVLLVSPNMPQEHLAVLQSAQDVFKHKYILGGEPVVPQAILDELFNA